MDRALAALPTLPAHPAAQGVRVGGVGALLAAKRNANTLAAYARDVLDLARFLAGQDVFGLDDPRAVRALLGATSADIARWRDELARNRLPATVARKLSAVRTFYKLATSEGLVRTNPATLVEAPKVQAHRARAPFLEAPEVRRLLAAPNTSTLTGKRDRVILALAFRLGLRSDEIRLLTVGQIERDGVGWKLRVVGKGGKERTLALNGVASLLRDYLHAAGLETAPAGALVFPSPLDPSRPLARRVFARIFARHAKRAGVVVEANGRVRELSPHVGRRTFATRVLDCGGSIEALRRAMGHANTATTARYDRRADADVVADY